MNCVRHIALLATPLVALGLTGCTDNPPTTPEPVTTGPCLDKDTCTETFDPDPADMEQGFAGYARASIAPTRWNPPQSDAPACVRSPDCVAPPNDRD